MLQICFDQKCREVDLSGSEAELMKFRDALLSVSHDPSLPCLLETEIDFDPSPYPHKLANITICIDDGPNLIRIHEGKLSISGSLAFIQILAQNVEYFEDSSGLADGDHIHFDKIWPDSTLDEMSLSLIIALKHDRNGS